jgi:hypothetical protein
MQGLLPDDAFALLQGVGKDSEDIRSKVSDQVEQVLLKLWQKPAENEDVLSLLTPEECNLDITPAELAAVWSLTHRRPIFPDTARQVLRRPDRRHGQIQPSHQWGSGPARRRLYRLGDVVNVRIRNTGRVGKGKGPKEDPEDQP